MNFSCGHPHTDENSYRGRCRMCRSLRQREYDDGRFRDSRQRQQRKHSGYHNGRSKERKARDVTTCEVIAVDTEGITHIAGSPQAPTIFGTSAAPPLQGYELTTMEMLEHLFDVDAKHPNALWVGYGFRYDSDMIVKDLPHQCLVQLYKDGRTWFSASGYEWRLEIRRGKWFTISRYLPRKRRHGSRYETGNGRSITIYDFVSFFGAKFLDTAESILGDELTEDDRVVIAEGKAMRGQNAWEDMPEMLAYWSREIQLMRRTFERFRAVMVQAGFALKEWYGPGALARYIIGAHDMERHLTGAQMPGGVMPEGVHEASKHAFAGGRFEPFKAGRIQGPIYVYDRNSAYPYATTMLPSLSLRAGKWVHVENPTEVERFGIYHVKAKFDNPDSYQPMPLFHRGPDGLISFPSVVEGWYMSPEARIVAGMPGVEMGEAWVWRGASVDSMNSGDAGPWAFMQEMYDQRMRLGKKNLLSLPFKLGPNSIYGKLAQTVGWDKERKLPPKLHALPLAAWITSHCRAALFAAMQRAGDKLIAVETDSVVTTATPDEMGLSFGNQLGQWGIEQYDEIIYVQSGVYFAGTELSWTNTRSLAQSAGIQLPTILSQDFETLQTVNWPKSGWPITFVNPQNDRLVTIEPGSNEPRCIEWKLNKTRGLDRADMSVENVITWLEGMAPGERQWPKLHVQTKPRFNGLGYAMHVATEARPFEEIFRVWEVHEKEIAFGDVGKRTHQPSTCSACIAGVSPAEGGHPLAISVERQFFAQMLMSAQRALPWETEHPAEVEEIRTNHAAENDMVAL